MEHGKLPGEELVAQGFRDLERGVESPESVLVSIGAPLLRRLGLTLPETFASPEHRLYELLRVEHGDAPIRATTRSSGGSSATSAPPAFSRPA